MLAEEVVLLYHNNYTLLFWRPIMVKRHISILTTGLMIAGFLLGACAPQTTPEPTSPPPEPTAIPATEAPTPETEPTESQAFTLTDALGREVQFEAMPERIVVPGKGSWMPGHALYLFPEAVERVLAMEERRGSVSTFLPLLDPGFGDKPHFEQDAAPEQIAPLHPDAIVLKSYMAQNLGEPLEKLGFPVVYVDLETPDQFFRDIESLGLLFGNPSRAQEINRYYRDHLERISAALDGLEETDKPDTLVLQYITSGEESAFEVPPASWMQTLQVVTGGGNPIWTDVAETGGWTVVNLEQIAAWDADKIFVIAFRADPDALVEELKADLKWQAMRAVKDGELYAFPADLYGWDLADPRWILGMTWTATVLHPDRFKDVDLTQEIYDFYAQMYGMDKAAVEASVLPALMGSFPQ
jgi:iron complex transport system substrate-binding protein